MTKQDTDKKTDNQKSKETEAKPVVEGGDGGSTQDDKKGIEGAFKEIEKEAKTVDEKSEKEKKVAGGSKSTAKLKKKKIRRQVQRGRAYINSTYNNTVVSLTDLHGNLLAWSSSGLLGFKGAKKATTFAANQVVVDVADKVEKYGLKDIEVYVKGIGSGREAAVRALAQRGFSFSLIKDKTPIPHNGCRPKKPRRV